MRRTFFGASVILAALLNPVQASSSGDPKAFFQSKTVIIPKDPAIDKGGIGEDSADTDSTVLCVADGVGGWAKKGIDSGEFSRLLTRTVIKEHERDVEVDAKKLLMTGCQTAVKEKKGSSTAVVLKLKSTGENTAELETANLGDSGYSIFHINKSTGKLSRQFKSESQQLFFNAPFQCGTGSAKGETRAAKRTHNVKDGDVVLVYSDGLIDNVEPEDWTDCIEAEIKDGLIQSLSRAADCLARKAHFLGKDTQYRSPFIKEQERAYNAGEKMTEVPDEFIGGKEDDVTVVLAQVFMQSKHEQGDCANTLSKSDKYFPDSKHVYKKKPDGEKPNGKTTGSTVPPQSKEESKPQSVKAVKKPNDPPSAKPKLTATSEKLGSTLNKALAALEDVKHLKESPRK